MMDYNYHTHTFRCRHASGTAEEYIKCAIQGGIRSMGFSDHAPFLCSDGHESSYRVPIAEAKEYIDELITLREQYKNQIELSIGFEMEYYEAQFEQMLENVVSYGAEYLILGPHFLKEEHPDGIHTNQKTDSVELLRSYASNVIKGMETGVFTYVAHPDIIRFVGAEKVFRQEMRRICVASKQNDIPLEINFLGIRGNRNYPNEVFWSVAGEEQSPVTFGFDAHEPPDAADKASLQKAKELVNRYHLHYIGRPKLRPLGQNQSNSVV